MVAAMFDLGRSVNSEASRLREFLCSHSSALFIALRRSPLATVVRRLSKELKRQEVRKKGKKTRIG